MDGPCDDPAPAAVADGPGVDASERVPTDAHGDIVRPELTWLLLTGGIC